MDATLMIGQSIAMLTLILLVNSLLLPPANPVLKPVLFLHIFLCGTVAASLLGQFSSLPQLLAGLAILSFSDRPIRRWNLILYQLGWFWSVLTDYAVTIPLRLLGFDFEAIRASIPLMALFYTLHALLAILPARCIGAQIRRKLTLEPDFLPPRFQNMLLADTSICSCILLFHIIWGSYSDYPTEILTFNGLLFFCFALVHLFLSLNLYQTMQENQRLALRAQAREKLAEYTEQLENHYQEMRRFKHDYMNLLSTLNGYILEGDPARLQAFFEQKIMPGSRVLLNKDSIIARLSGIKIPEIKGILYTKIVHARNLNLNIELELTENIDRIDMNLLTLSRILGIYLDNAIEAAAQTSERRLRIALIREEGQVTFYLENSTRPLSVPLDRLFAEGVSTKEHHAGLGLASAAALLSGVSNATVQTACRNGVFTQILTITARPNPPEIHIV